MPDPAPSTDDRPPVGRERERAALRAALVVSRQARDTARAAGREEFARHEDDAIAELEKRIAWLERQAAEFEERQARGMDEEEG